MADKKITEKRLARLEEVFEAIANAWAATTPGPAPSPGAPGDAPGTGTVPSMEDAKKMLGTSLIDKISSFSSGLEPPERQQLYLLLEAALRGVAKEDQQFENPQQTEGVAFLKELDGKFSRGEVETLGGANEVGPTVTITTTTTIAASHPFITCNVQVN